MNAILYSLVETAKVNHVNVQYYLQYLFEQIPLRRARGNTDFMADMMPWSETYREYEKEKLKQQQTLFGQLFPVPDRPRTPRRKDVAASREGEPGTAANEMGEKRGA